MKLEIRGDGDIVHRYISAKTKEWTDSAQFGFGELDAIIGLDDKGVLRWGYRGAMTEAEKDKFSFENGSILHLLINTKKNGKWEMVPHKIDLSEHIRYDKARDNLHQFELPVVPRDKLTAAETKNTELSAKVKQLEAKLAAEVKIVEEAKKTNQELAKKADTFEKEAKDTKTKLDASEKNAKDLKAKLDDTAAKLDVSEKTANDLKAKLDTSEKNATDLKTKLDVSEKSVQDVKAKLDTAEKNAAAAAKKSDDLKKAFQDWLGIVPSVLTA